MAIVQVSRITNRKGLAENLPQLAGAELGWAIDTRQLYIGNGTLQDGAPVIGNTEILTEFSDITIQQGTYIREAGVQRTLLDNTANQTITTFNAAAIRAVQIDYTITRGVNTRTGVYTIVAGTDSSGTNLTGNDTGYQNASTGVTFNQSEASNIVSWLASTTGTGTAATISFSITRLA